MTLGTHDAVEPREQADAGRSRDAARTRRLLLEAARRRFAHDGYSSTTSRDIAGDVGVNVALVNRYFGSKEGLFEACLERTVEELDDEAAARTPGVEDVIQAMIEQIGRPAGSERPLQLLLLLRASGDERVDAIRRRTMHRFTERMATIAGWRPDDPRTSSLLLRAQLAMAVGFGLVVMREGSDLEPLATATAEQLGDALHPMLSTLLAPSGLHG